MTDYLRRLVDHLEWADELVLESLKRTRTPLPAANLLYAHVLGAEHTWLSRIQREAATVPVWPELTFEECETIAQANVKRLRELLESVREEDLARPVTYRTSAGVEYTTRLDDILMHVALHGAYHRGQVAALLRSAGDEPNPTDYIQWVRGGPAATRKRS